MGHSYILQDNQWSVDTADGVIAQARLHTHRVDSRVYLFACHRGYVATACVFLVVGTGAGAWGVVLLYYRRVDKQVGGLRPGGKGALWMRGR
jgi:hypothetical protein